MQLLLTLLLGSGRVLHLELRVVRLKVLHVDTVHWNIRKLGWRGRYWVHGRILDPRASLCGASGG